MERPSAIAKIVIGGAVLLLMSVPSRTSADTSTDYVIRSDVRLVLLDVSVKNREGELVSGLTKQNFTVTENGRPQPITVFAHNDLPVTVGIVVDESASMGPKRADVLAAAQTFIQESNRQDETFVLNFNDSVKRGLPQGILFSDNPAQLHTALFRGVPQGKTALNDAVIAGLEQLQMGRRDKKALVLISDGGDNASKSSRKEMLAKAHGTIATIYSIGIYDADDPDRNPGLLKELANISGGEAYFPESPAAMIPLCREIARDIRARYTIGYVPPPDNGTRALRHIALHASASGLGKLAVHTRTSYRYEETASQDQK
jgi:Ca-activated chloride channel homolog